MNRTMTLAAARVALARVYPEMTDDELVAMAHETAEIDERLDAAFAASPYGPSPRRKLGGRRR